MRRGSTVVSGFIAVTAGAGALELVTGWPRSQPLEWLEPTPFDSYGVPGLLLGGLVGGTAALPRGPPFSGHDTGRRRLCSRVP